MTLDEIKSQVMYQTNNDKDDLPDFEPHLTDYINEGYDILLVNYAEQHVSSDSEQYPPLSQSTDEPMLPEHAHRALADYATYLVYRNGNSVKQNRGMAYYSAFLEVMSRLVFERGGMTAEARQFRNIFSR